MAWNQPGGVEPPKSRRPGGGGALDALLSRWAKRLVGGGSGDSGSEGSKDNRWLPRALAGVLLLAWLGSGFYQIDAAERGVILRFGKFQSMTQIGSGMGWHLPWPVEAVSRVNVSNINSIDYQSHVLTSDVNLVNVTCAVQYQNADALKVLFQVRDPEETLREVSESAIREVIGQTTLDTVLAGAERAAIMTRTRDLIQKSLDGYQSGIHVVSVNLTEVQVPDAVQAAQRDADKATEDGVRYGQEAQAYANDLLPRAQGTAQHQLLDAQAYKAQVIAKAEGDTARFNQLAAAYAQAPEVTRNRLYIETMSTILARSRKVIIDAKTGSGNMIYLPLDKMLEASGGRGVPAATPVEIAAPAPIPTPASAAAVPGAAPPAAAAPTAAAAPVDSNDGRSRDRAER